MKNLRLNLKNLIIIAIISLIIVLLYKFGSIQYVEKNNSPNPKLIGDDCGLIEFSTNAEYIVGVIFEANRLFYMPQEENNNLKIELSYVKDGAKLSYTENIKLREIKKGINTINIDSFPVDDAEQLSITLSKENELQVPNYLSINCFDTNPDLKVDSSPRIIVKRELKIVVDESIEKLKGDRKFFIFIRSIVYLLAIVTIILLLIKKRED